jgi:hypothetical protein
MLIAFIPALLAFTSGWLVAESGNAQEGTGLSVVSASEHEAPGPEESNWTVRISAAIEQTEDGAFEVKSIEFLRALVTNDMVTALGVIDTSLDIEEPGKSYSGERLRQRIRKTHPAIRLLDEFRKRLTTAALTFEVPDPRFEFARKKFWLWLRRDGSNASADRFALGIVDDSSSLFEAESDEGSAHLTVGGWKRFGCWETPEDQFLAYVDCGVQLEGMPNTVAEQVEQGKLRARFRWHGIPRLAKARTVLIRGLGYETTRVMVAKQPSLEILSAEGEVLWTLR